MIYRPRMLGLGMEVFDALPREIRDKLNDGVVTQNGDEASMGLVYRLWLWYGTEHVLRVLDEAAQDRLAAAWNTTSIC